MRVLKYFFINWKDGMKINKSHYIAQENAILYQQAQGMASLLNNHNYGLLPSEQNSGNRVKLFLSVDNQQQISLRLQHCLAITRGGHTLQFGEDTSSSANQIGAYFPNLTVGIDELKATSSNYYVVITVDPFARVPFGLADPNEQPARIPYTRAAYHLSLMGEQDATKDVLGLFQLPVGKLKLKEQKLSLDEDYIPPCSSISSHPELLSFYNHIVKFYCAVEINSLQIIQKILQKKQDNQKARIVKKLCEKITTVAATHIPQLNTISLTRPPIELIYMISAFARTIKNTLDQYVETGKEDVINYFKQWCRVDQGEFDGTITALANHQFNQIDIMLSIEKVCDFTKLLSGILKNLNGLDYIGEVNTSEIFIDAKAIIPENKQAMTTGYSFLFDE